jgi:hypothetical protein
MRRSSYGIALFLTVFAAPSTEAAPVTWTLDNISFSSYFSAPLYITGTFDYDANSATFSNQAFFILLGSTCCFTVIHDPINSTASSLSFSTLAFGPGSLTLASPMENTGGSIALTGGWFGGVGLATLAPDQFVTAPVTPGIPEPTSWAMLIAGFGLTGAAMRRRRVSVLTA